MAEQAPGVSATRLQTLLDCQRKYWFEYIGGKRSPENEAMARGTAVHSEVETFLLTGAWNQHEDPEDRRWLAGHIARAGERFLLPLRAQVAAGTGEVERPIKYDGYSLPFTGRIDLAINNPRMPRIVDHKTTSNLTAFWHLDEAGMANNLQLLLYALHGFEKPADSYQIGHIYYQTKPPWGARELHVEVPRQALVDAGSLASKATDRVAALMEEKDPNKVPTRRVTCKKYGGCPHASYCLDSPVNEERRNVAISMRLKEVKLKPSTRRPDMGLFSKGKPTPAAINPPDRVPDPPVFDGATEAIAKKARAAMLDQWGPAANFGGDIGDWLAHNKCAIDPEELLVYGLNEGWWTSDATDSYILAHGDAPAIATAPKPRKPAQQADAANAERAELIAKIEAGIPAAGGAEAFESITKQLQIKQFRKAGLDNLRALWTALEAAATKRPTATPAPKPATPGPRKPVATPKPPGSELAPEDATTILAALCRAAHEQDEEFAIVSLADMTEALVDSGLTPQEGMDRMLAAANHGNDKGWWSLEGNAAAPNWGVIWKTRGIGKDAPAEAPEPNEPSLSGYIQTEPTSGGTVVSSPVRLLFVGCVPVNYPCPDLEDWADDAIATVEERENMPISLVEFNKGPAMVASEVKVRLIDGRLLLPPMLLGLRSPLTSALVPVLSAFGMVPVVGVLS